MDKNKKQRSRFGSPLSMLFGTALLLLIAIIAVMISFQPESPVKARANETINLRMALLDSSTFPASVGAADFAERVREKSGGRINIELFHNGRLGMDENSVAEQVQIGGIDIACVPISAMESFAPSLDLLQLPYLIADEEHLHRVIDSELGQRMLHESDSKKLLGLAFYDEGPRIYCNSVHAVSRTDDLKDLRLGVPKNPLYTTVCEIFSAQAEKLSHGDVYRSLKTGRINGLDDNLIGYVLNSRYSMAKYVTLTEHAMPPSIVIASQDVFDGLSEEDIAIIYDSAQKSVAAQRRCCKRLIESTHLFFETGACEVVDDNWTKTLFAVLSRDMYKSYGGYTEEIAYIESLKTVD